MSEQEQRPIRLQAWEDYQAARQSHLIQRQKLEDMARLLTSAKYVSGEDLGAHIYPTSEDVSRQIEDFGIASEHLRRCCLAARELGLPVEEKDCT